jgi:TBC1 domain family member 2
VRRAETVARKRQSYIDAVAQHYASKPAASGERVEDLTMRQIAVDIPRTSPGISFFRIPQVQAALERVLYVWATRHPASGYVQGMNDLVTPFFFVFVSEYAPAGTGMMEMLDWLTLDALETGGSNVADALANAEADAYWCLTTLLNDIQDYYTFAQPGIQRRVQYLRDLVGRVDGPLRAHLEGEGLDFMQFAFRWMNCLLMRELPFPTIVRVWDTYLAEPHGFDEFHVYVCAALLVWYSNELQEMEFQDMVMFLQNLPTHDWTSQEINVILSQAYMWLTIFGAAPSHLQSQ